MAIVKSKHAGNFTTLPNSILKQELTLEALGLLVHLLSLPHDWIVYKTTLHKQFKIGEHKMDRVFKELQDKGYILSVKKHDGQRYTYEHIVYDLPFNGEQGGGFQGVGKQPVAEQGVENPVLLNTNTQSTKVTKETNNKERDRALSVSMVLNKLPTIIEIQQYCNSRGNKIDPRVFYEKMEAVGWTVGGQPIKNWKAVINSWERREIKEPPTQSQQGMVR